MYLGEDTHKQITNKLYLRFVSPTLLARDRDPLSGRRIRQTKYSMRTGNRANKIDKVLLLLSFVPAPPLPLTISIWLLDCATLNLPLLTYYVCVFCSVFNNYPVKWSVEKAKKELKRSCNNYHGVADFGQTLHAICTKSNSEKWWCQRGARSTALRHCLRHWCQVRDAVSSACTAPRLEAVYKLFEATKDSLKRKRYDHGHHGP